MRPGALQKRIRCIRQISAQFEALAGFYVSCLGILSDT